jgi:hypothetical protein
MLISTKVPTIEDFKNIIIKKAIIGEKSIPAETVKGNNFLIGYKKSSVDLYKNWTIGLRGSGFTQLTSALIKISQYKTVNIASISLAEDDKKSAVISIKPRSFRLLKMNDFYAT